MKSVLTPEGLFEFYIATYDTLRSMDKKLTHSEKDEVYRVFIREIGLELTSARLVFCPGILWLSAAYQGVWSWLHDVAGHLKPEIAPPTQQEDFDAIMHQLNHALSVVTALPSEQKDVLREGFRKTLPQVTGAPYGGCFLGFDNPISILTDSDAWDKRKEGTTAFLITNNVVIAFRTPLEAEDGRHEIGIHAFYIDKEWLGLLSGTPHIVLSLIQIINLARDQAKPHTSFGFKRFAQQTTKRYRVKVKHMPPVYVFPKNVEPPERELRYEVKMPGMKESHIEPTAVIMTKKQTLIERYMGLRTKVREFHKRRKLCDYHDEEEKRLAETFINALYTARLFEIPFELYNAFYHQADKYTTEQIAGFEWEPLTDPNKEWAEDRMSSMDFVDVINQAGAHIELPKNRPFDTFYFGYSTPPLINEHMYIIYRLDENDGRQIQTAELIGHLVVGDLVYTCIDMRYWDGRHAYSYLVEKTKKEWIIPYTLAPWIVTALIDWINDHQTIVHDDTRVPEYRRAAAKAMREVHLKHAAPPPFYTVYMRDIVVNKSAKKTFGARFKKVIEWSHRWEVRGHSMVRIKRGSLPIDPKLEKLLKKRNYKIYSGDAKIPFETWQKLEARQIPQHKDNEWLAVLVSFRTDFIKGPEDKPLVPSLRKSARYANVEEGPSMFDNQDVDETD